MPGKNLKLLAGIPLVAHAIRRAQGAARILGGEHRVVCSTDSEDIAGVARAWGAEVLMRPDALATDEATSGQVVEHAARYFADLEVLLVQPTSPLASDMDIAMASSPSPQWLESKTVGPDGRANGAAYATWGSRPFVGEFGVEFVMPASRSIDIDTADDWHMAEALLAARPLSPFVISGREIGPGHPCFVIAEAGVNHDGDPEKAHALIDAAAMAGADAVKFQTFVPDLLAEPGPHRDMLADLCLPMSAWAILKDRAEKRGLIFLSSPFDVPSVDFLDSLNVAAFKVPSGEITNLPLLWHIASKGKPVILSTGMANMLEVAQAVDALAGVPLALLHCVSEYPADPATVNLRAMDTLRMAFGFPVGWSDHTTAEGPAEIAVARGACIVEKHITLDPSAPGPDHAVSEGPHGFRMMVEGIRSTEAALGTGEKVPTAGEAQTARIARRRDGLRRSA